MADSIAGAVASALVQEVVGRVVSGLVLLAGTGTGTGTGKRDEKAPASSSSSQAQEGAGAAAAGQHKHNVERLKMAVSQLEFALERTGKLPITDVSLLDQRKMFKLAYVEGTDLLLTNQRHSTLAAAAAHHHRRMSDDEEALANHQHGRRRSNPPKRRRWILAAMARPFSSSSSSSPPSSSPAIDADVVRRFEWFADSAGRFVRDVADSGTTLRHHTFFCNPVVRRLLEGKHLRYESETTEQAAAGRRRRRRVLRFLDLWPLCIEGRGVETILEYRYQDGGAPEKNLLLHVVLRLSESTDVFGTAVACLRAMASQLNLLVVSEAAVGELALLATSVDMSRSVAPPWARIDEGDYARASQAFRQDPVCCKENNWQQQHSHGGRRPRATTSGGDTSPELSRILPEEIIVLAFWCCLPVPAPECGLSPSRCWRPPPLKMTVFFSPHACYHHDAEEEQQRRRSWALDLAAAAAAGENGDPPLLRDVSVQQVAEMVRPKAVDCFLRQPHLPLYAITWGSEHGKAIFIVEKPTSTERTGAGEEPRKECKPEVHDR
ncbi:hypothetical protein SORBI_3008G133900 [Sorghum bicolor]|uniref:Uncharacterized protein n=1 Tax=Sorghum bicolor TaxID=4558 RepID=A0A1B6PDI2_SORBI|nr:hypothetical protein SORBI_3008G133900 [Sorghum bicolor]